MQTLPSSQSAKNEISLAKINALHSAIEKTLSTTEPELDYLEVTEKIIELCAQALAYEGENDLLWEIGDTSYCTVDCIIIGAFWHYAEWHSGQDSLGYAALSACGSVYSSGMNNGPEEGTGESEIFDALAELATAHVAELLEEGNSRSK